MISLAADEVDSLFDTAQRKAVEAVGGHVRLPKGAYKLPSGKFVSRIGWGGKKCHIGTFATPEQASAAYMSVKKDLEDATSSALGADEVEAIFNEAKTKALDLCGGRVRAKRHGLPRGVNKNSSGNFASRIRLGDKQRYIGTFATPEQASAAYMSAKNDLDTAKQSACDSSDEVKNAVLVRDAAKKKALFGGIIHV